MRILIAEDDPTSRTVLAAMLHKSGHEVVETADGAAAWEVLQRPDSPALAILDWMMPKIDGLELVRRVRALGSDRPPYLMMLTVRGDAADIIVGLEAGANDYLAKPFDPGELRARVEVGRRMIAIQDNLLTKVGELRQAFDQIKTLRGIVPICASCKNIRDDQGFWTQVEVYVHAHTEAQFSHGICPKCLTKLYPELGLGEGASPSPPVRPDTAATLPSIEVRPDETPRCDAGFVVRKTASGVP